MLDLSGMKGIQSIQRRGRSGRAGLTLGEFDRATQAFGLATTLGVVSMTGIAGLTLGGGLGWLNGRYARLRQPDIRRRSDRRRAALRASAQQNEDLFWGIRAAATSGSSPHSSTNSIRSISYWPAACRTPEPGSASFVSTTTS